MFLSFLIYTDLKDRSVEKMILSFSLVEGVFNVYEVLFYYDGGLPHCTFSPM